MIDNIPRGTVIEAVVDGRTLRRTVATTMFCDINEGYADIEFKDPEGNYGHYKSSYDKRRIIFPNGVIFDYNGAR